MPLALLAEADVAEAADRAKTYTIPPLFTPRAVIIFILLRCCAYSEFSYGCRAWRYFRYSGPPATRLHITFIHTVMPRLFAATFSAARWRKRFLKRPVQRRQPFPSLLVN